MFSYLKSIFSPEVLIWFGIIMTVFIWAVVIFATPIAVRKIPPDFFSKTSHLKPRGRSGRPWLVYAAIVAFRNIAGIALIVLGTVGLQGVLVVILGLAIMDIPGKARAIQHLAVIPFVWRLMSKIRSRANLPPLEKPLF